MTVIDSILRRLKRLPQGEPFTIGQLTDLGSPTVVRKHLANLAKDRVINRVAQGLYVVQTEGASPITPEKVATAVANTGRYRVRLVWTDRKEKSVFITDGPPRRIQMQGHAIEMRHVNPHSFDRYCAGQRSVTGNG